MVYRSDIELGPDERWLPVVGFEGLYEVSDYGRVRSLDRVVGGPRGSARRIKGRILSPGFSRYGYLTLVLSRDAQPSTVRVHRLVAMCFVGPPPFEEAQVRHLDGNPLNCYFKNLDWGTYSDNMLDRVSHGRHHNEVKTHCNRGHEFTEANTIVEERMYHYGPGLARRCRKCHYLACAKYHYNKKEK